MLTINLILSGEHVCILNMIFYKLRIKHRDNMFVRKYQKNQSKYYIFVFIFRYGQLICIKNNKEQTIIRFCCKFDFELSLFIYESSTNQLELTPINIKY
jgi:hypothetical protein